MRGMFNLLIIANLDRYVKPSALYRVAVVGGGAAGYFGAIECANQLNQNIGISNFEVVIFEAGKQVLSKVLISGGGRCNVMHDPRKGPKLIAKGYPRGSKELLGPLTSKFGPEETFDWFVNQGIRLKTEKDGRVFPVTDRSETVINALEKAAKSVHVRIKQSSHVNSIKLQNSADSAFAPTQDSSSIPTFILEYSSRAPPSEQSRDDGSASTTRLFSYIANKVIFCTGASRKGYDILTSLGHSMESPLPSLFSFKILDDALTSLSGLSLPSIEVRLVLSKELQSKLLLRGGAGAGTAVQLRQCGACVITHQGASHRHRHHSFSAMTSGLSGPAVLKLSAHAARVLASLDYKFELEVNWFPQATREVLFAHFSAQRTRNPQKLVGTWFPPLHISELDDLSDELLEIGNSNSVDINLSSWEDGEETDSPTDLSSTTGGLELKSEINLPRRLWHYLLSKAGVDGGTAKWGTLTRAQTTSLADMVTRQRLMVTGRGAYRDEFVTCGGVRLKEVNIDTMESRVVPGLYLAGEVLDVDGITGGYNFQAAWTSGWIAGHSCAKSIINKK